ncbi:hypothetical protein [Streptomyces sp. NBC_00145]|uniref:hypothetical protein n=1 Tax=Streptomyces sp. NBC_00145 TaxID=2975666 RepID=UPI002E170C12
MGTEAQFREPVLEFVGECEQALLIGLARHLYVQGGAPAIDLPAERADLSYKTGPGGSGMAMIALSMPRRKRVSRSRSSRSEMSRVAM